ncbi:MAG: hypothetical protein SFY70_09620 [Bacteroidia bacterium]|nr:hypothetical protein [Bacteroidia bacterium]
MRTLLVSLLALALLLVAPPAHGQCAMCKANVESGVNDPNNTNNVGKGLNTGILYLLAMPYLAGAVIAFAWYRQRKRGAARQSTSASAL